MKKNSGCCDVGWGSGMGILCCKIVDEFCGVSGGRLTRIIAMFMIVHASWHSTAVEIIVKIILIFVIIV